MTDDRFINLHVHSTFSFQDGLGTPEQYVKRCKEIGQTSIGLTDHGNISAHHKWYSECNKLGIKPILGCELYVKPESGDNENYHHMTVLAINGIGYSNLLSIVTESWKNFHSKPIVSLEFIIEHQKGLLITSSCPSGKVCKLIGLERTKHAEDYLKHLKNNIENFFIEVQPWEYKGGKELIPKLHKLSKQLKIPMLATMDCHYPLKEQSHIQETLLCIQSNDKMSNPKRWKIHSKECVQNWISMKHWTIQ